MLWYNASGIDSVCHVAFWTRIFSLDVRTLVSRWAKMEIVRRGLHDGCKDIDLVMQFHPQLARVEAVRR